MSSLSSVTFIGEWQRRGTYVNDTERRMATSNEPSCAALREVKSRRHEDDFLIISSWRWHCIRTTHFAAWGIIKSMRDTILVPTAMHDY